MMARRLARAGAGTALCVLLAVAYSAPAFADPTTPDPTPTATPTPGPSPSPSEPTPAPSPGEPTPAPSPSEPIPVPTPAPLPGPTGPAPSSSGKPAIPATSDAGGSDGAIGLSQGEVTQQVAAADAIWTALTAANADLAAAMKKMDALSVKANDLLEAIATARDQQQSAEAAANTARSELDVVSVRLENAREITRMWAFQTYAESNGTGDLSSVFDVMGKDPAQAAPSAGDLAYLTDARLRSLQELGGLEAQQAQLSAEADQASATAAAATATLEQSKAALDPLLAGQRSEIDALRTAQMAEIAQAGPVAALLIGVQTPQARAAADRLRAALAAASASPSFSGGTPCSDNESTYPNGQLPPSALCPLWGATGEELRPTAAAAFNAMSQAYAKQMGTPLCVTDSYRTLAEQFSVKASRGKWAATPGTSHHGLGIAVDLCGGIETFGSPQHLWMQLNAPLYGWYHPSWAEPNGTLPEPWHWEFAG